MDVPLDVYVGKQHESVLQVHVAHMHKHHVNGTPAWTHEWILPCNPDMYVWANAIWVLCGSPCIHILEHHIMQPGFMEGCFMDM